MAISWYELAGTSHYQEWPCDCPPQHVVGRTKPESTEILKRRPDDWNGTLLSKNDVHPTAEQGGATASSAPTAENLRNSGYLLRGWLSVKKIAEVSERTVLDAKP